MGGLDYRSTQVFERNAVDLDLLRELTDDDLEKVGVHALGHRKKLLKAIAELKDSEAAASTAHPIQQSPSTREPVGTAYSNCV